MIDEADDMDQPAQQGPVPQRTEAGFQTLSAQVNALRHELGELREAFENNHGGLRMEIGHQFGMLNRNVQCIAIAPA